MWSAVIALGLLSCESKKTPDSSQAPEKSNRGDREDSPSSRTGFEAGLKTAEEMADPAQRNEALAVLARDAMEDRPDLAQMAILKLPADSPELPDLLGAYLTGLLESRPAEALAWTDSLEDEEMFRMARELLVELVPDEQLATAAPKALDGGKIADTGFKPGDERMLQRWALTDPQASAAWLAKLPAGDARNEGFRSVSRSLVQGGDEPATHWLNALPSEKLRAAAKETMAAALMETPEPIRVSLLGPPDSELRRQLGEELARLQPPPAAEPAEEPMVDDPAAAGE